MAATRKTLVTRLVITVGRINDSAGKTALNQRYNQSTSCYEL